ncbi:MAG: alanine dehydrogenase [Cytophagales bacterium]|nr:alanine dehydrogenase [Cytophagales bacterium]
MAKSEIKGFAKLAKEQSLYPQEAPDMIRKVSNQLELGIPKETSHQENRVSLKPEAVSVLVNSGHKVLVESGAGAKAHFTDNEYSESGATISDDTNKVFASELLLKIEPPTLKEIELLQPGGTLISAFQGGNQSAKFIDGLNRKRTTAIGYEFMEDKTSGLPLVRAMSEIAGSTVLLIAGEYLSSPNDGQGVILGGVTGVPPTKVIILGAGTVSEYAARAAIGLGVDIGIFDNHIYKLRRIKQALGHQIYTSTLDNALLLKSLKTADVLIGALRPEKGRHQSVVTEEMVQAMKPGAVIIDVSIDQGGCVETSELTSHKNPVFSKHEVIHYCVPNIASRVARTASIAISNILTPIIQRVGDEGGIDEMIYLNNWFMRGVYTYRGSLTNLDLAKKFNLGYKDLYLLMAARF